MAPSYSSNNFYDRLGVSAKANDKEIRQAYLKASLKVHPDKNPEDSEAAKVAFVSIGEAYETLKDPVKRAEYDRSLKRGGRFSGSSASNKEASYDNYRNTFDETVAGMSEAELAAAVSTVAAVAGMVGSVLGARLVSGKRSRGTNGGTGDSAAAAAGSMVGSMLATQVASQAVRSLHQQSAARVAYQAECSRALARGEPTPDPPEILKQGGGGKWREALSGVVDMFKNQASNEQGQQDTFGNQQPQQASASGNRSASDEQQQTSSSGSRWRDKMEGAAAAAATAAAVASMFSNTREGQSNSQQSQQRSAAAGGNQSYANGAQQNGSRGQSTGEFLRQAAAGVQFAADLAAKAAQQRQQQQQQQGVRR